MKARWCFIFAIGSLLIGACGDDDAKNTSSNPKVDTGHGNIGPVQIVDGGVKSDVLKEASVTPGICALATIGKKCTANGNECGTGFTCLALDENTGVCSCSTNCSVDDPETDAVNEDNCGTGAICVAVPISETETKNYCMKECKPQIGKNDCDPSIACDPFISENYYGLWFQSVCGQVKCVDDWSCEIFSETTCTQDTDCTAIKTGSKCRPYTSTAKRCSLPGKCDATSGLCDVPTGVGDSSKKIGSPCKSDWECAAGQTCLPESPKKNLGATGVACTADADCCSGTCDTTTKKCTEGLCRTIFRNGYCTVIGCNSEATFNPVKCGDTALCNHSFNYGLCQKKCDAATASDCRGQTTIDKLGDYECYDWSPYGWDLPTGFVQIATGPVCDFGTRKSCATVAKSFGQTDPCPLIAPKNNPQHMKCRKLDNTDAASTNSASGFCLDDTASSTSLSQ